MNKEEYIKQYMDKHAGSAYMTGAPAALKHGFELALGFAEWANMIFEFNSVDNTWSPRLTTKTYTTQQLFTKYLNTKK